MVVFWGARPYGKSDEHSGSYVVTRFAYLQFLPLVPSQSFLIVASGGPPRALALPLVGRSVLAGYARIWSPVAAFVGLAVACSGAPFVGGTLLALSVAVGLYAWIRLGRLTAPERAHREAYAAFAGAPVDVALIASATRGPDAAAAAAWLADITRRAEETIRTEGAELAASYRELARHTDWRQVAARADTAPSVCQKAALTLARVAWATTTEPASRAAAASAHDRIWSAVARQ
jgi:hypothetical protein